MSRSRKKKCFRKLYTKDPTGLEFRFDFIRPMPCWGNNVKAPAKEDLLATMWGHWHRDSIELDDERQMISLYFEDERDFVLASLTIPAE